MKSFKLLSHIYIMDTSGNNVTEAEIQRIGNMLCDAKRPLKERFRSLFTLRNLGGPVAVECICACFADPSALLKHECAYCLGQMQSSCALPKLEEVLKDTTEDPMVRHEAGEAMGAIGDPKALTLLEKYCNDPCVDVAETCQLAVERLRWLENQDVDPKKGNPYLSVDPAPPATQNDLNSLRETLLNESLPLFQRYRAMFSLRNIGGSEAALVLSEGLKCAGALFRHEIAYVLGQMQEESSVPQLKINLMDNNESAMVRHECAEALGSIATPDCMDVLKVYIADNERVVRESCEVALDMCEYEQSGGYEYANTLAQHEETQNKT